MQRKLKMLAVAGAVLGSTAMSVTPAAAASGTLNGAGSTLVAPLVGLWAPDYKQQTGNTVNYSGVGSGTGIKDVSSRLVDFGASDAPLSSSQAAACHTCYQIPWALSATGVSFNLGSIKRLRLTGPIIADIYLGSITRWNDSRIRAVNPGLSLPSEAITPIYRSDGSGDTYAFTDYLTSVSGTWASRVNRGTSVSFPHGVGGAKNSGVATILENTPGGIAYIAVSYLIGQGLPAASIRNAAGNFRGPNFENIENAARSVRSVPNDLELHIVNPPRSARIAYPISTFTYAIVPAGAPQGALMRNFLYYALNRGQRFGAGLDFAPVPKLVLRAARVKVGSIH